MLRQTKTSRIGEIIHIDDVFIRFQQLSVDDSVCYFFSINESYEPYPIGQCYEAGEGWKFVILNIFIANDAKEDITFHVGCMEDENGAVFMIICRRNPKLLDRTGRIILSSHRKRS